MTDLLTLVSTVVSLFTSLGVGVDVDALLARRHEEIRALEVYAIDESSDLGLSCPGAPPWVIVQIRSDGIVVGEEDHPVQVSSWSALQTQLDALKDARRDRDTVLIDVDDDVAFARVARVVDLLHGTDMKATVLHVSAKKVRPTIERWQLPPPWSW